MKNLMLLSFFGMATSIYAMQDAEQVEKELPINLESDSKDGGKKQRFACRAIVKIYGSRDYETLDENALYSLHLFDTAGEEIYHSYITYDESKELAASMFCILENIGKNFDINISSIGSVEFVLNKRGFLHIIPTRPSI